jgi:hypothetical protein
VKTEVVRKFETTEWTDFRLSSSFYLTTLDFRVTESATVFAQMTRDG